MVILVSKLKFLICYCRISFKWRMWLVGGNLAWFLCVGPSEVIVNRKNRIFKYKFKKKKKEKYKENREKEHNTNNQ